MIHILQKKANLAYLNVFLELKNLRKCHKIIFTFCHLRLLNKGKRKLDDVNPVEETMNDDEYIESACYKTKRRCHAFSDPVASCSALDLKNGKPKVKMFCTV